MVDAGSREENHARADADVALARAALDEARAMLEKTIVRAPIDGIVLRRNRRAGESVSTQFDSPIVTLADRSRVRVRMDVDESDVAHLRVGQPAYVTADAFGDRRFAGAVVRIGQVLGKKECPHGRTDGARGHQDPRDADRALGWPRTPARPARAGVYSLTIRKNRSAVFSSVRYWAGAVPAGFGTSVLMSLKFSTVLNSMLNSPKFCQR